MSSLPLFFAWGLCASVVAATDGRVLASDLISNGDQLSLSSGVPARTEDAFPRFLDAPSPSLDVSGSSQPSTLPAREKSASTQPEANSAASGEFPEPGGAFGLGEFIRHFAPYEPMYFVGRNQGAECQIPVQHPLPDLQSRCAAGGAISAVERL
jgi:hypothetical protein